MIEVKNNKSSYIIIGGKSIKPFGKETFEERNAMIRSLERAGIIVVREIPPVNNNPVTPELFNYTTEISKEVTEQKEEVEIVTTVDEKEVEEDKEVKTSKRKKNSKKKGEIV